jgi:poly(glycerol-phosphate) alpha-glucosyltransferase
MYFFVNTALNKQNSGIEHAQLQRVKVFKDHHVPCKLIYTAWNPQLDRWLSRFGLVSNDALTLFDYYQGTQSVKSKIVTPNDIFLADVETRFEVDPQHNNCYLVKQNNSLMGRIHWFDGFSDNIKRVSMVERFDIYGNLYRVDEYDVRGFLSRSQYYTPDNKVYMFVWFDLKGRPVLSQTFSQNVEHKTVAGVWEVVDRENRRHYYQNYRTVVAKYLDDLNNEYWSVDEPNYFVGDRMEGYEDALMQLTKPAIKIAHLHNSHGADVHDEMHSLLNNYYEFDLYNNDRYDFYVAATHKQTVDVRNRFGLGNRVVTIPVGLTERVKQVSQLSRKPHSVLVTARRAEEKRIDKIIEAVAKARTKIPDISLDVYGYRDSRNHDAAKKKIDAMIKKYNVEDCVSINDYNPDLDTARDQHQVYMVFSTMEGFNIALMEAQNHGEIGVVNDVNYGPNELVVDQKNGYVVDYDDVDRASERLVEIFSNADLAQSLSDNAYAYSERYSSDAIFKAWQTLVSQAMVMWKNTVRRNTSVKGLEEVPDLDAAIVKQSKIAVEREKKQIDEERKVILKEIKDNQGVK